MTIFKLLTYLLLALLPVAILIRDWKVSDRRTKRHHNITRTIIILWCIGSLVGTCFVWIDSNNMADKMTELIDGKNLLLARIKNYQKDLKVRQKRIDELEQRSNIIQSLELHVFANIKTLQAQITDRKTSAGLSSAIALFAKDKTRYRFVTDFQFAMHQIAPKVKRVEFIYRPETPLQILGKQIDFLRKMDRFVCNYKDFLRRIKISDSLGSSLDLTVFLNGVDVITLRDLNCGSGILSGGQVMMDIHDSFAEIPERYKAKIKEKGIEK